MVRERVVAVLLSGALFAGSGCHAKFQKEASSLGRVRTQAIVTGMPNVELGKVYEDSLGAAIVNAVQEVRSVKPAMRIANAVDIDQVNVSMQQGVADVLQSGPPFAFTTETSAAVLQLETMSWGLYVPYIGAPGEFYYDMRVRIYKPNGERVYKTTMHCTTASGSPPPEALVLGTVNNVKQLEEMTNRQIQDAFESVARWCGGQLVSKMRRHAA